MSFDWEAFAAQEEPVDPKIAELFRGIDTNGSGNVSRNELFHAMQNLNKTQFSKETIVLLISLFDREGNGCLDLRQFAGLYYFIGTWIKAFRKYDKGRTGYIMRREMMAVFRDANIHIDGRLVRRLIFKFGRHGSKLSLDSFIRIATVVKRLVSSFEDKQTDGVIKDLDQDLFIEMALRSCF